jgi:hypothetical protein
MPTPAEGREKRIILGDTAGAVQKDQRTALTRLEYLDLAAAFRNIE